MSFKKSFFSPLAFWKNLFKKPTTVRYPKEDITTFGKEGAAPTYRGLHSNDIHICIGCGTCADICPTAAIKMVEGENKGEGKLGKRPEIDYGRCCFCAFCVDICPTGSLNMSRDYLFNYPTPIDKFGDDEVEDVKKTLQVVAGDKYIHNLGYQTPDELSWLDLNRVKIEHLAPEKRWDNFLEIIKGYSKKQAEKEASRCVECGVCTETCPAHMNIPEYIRAIWDGDVEESVRQIYEDNPLPNVCGRVCTHKCESVCAISHRGEAIAIRWLKRYAVDSLPTEEIIKVSKEYVKGSGNKKISIIGGGPSGLSAAYYLSLLGHKVTVYDEGKKAGGVMRYGIPAYRLPDEALDRDIEVIRSLGVEIKTGQKIGKDLSMDRIKKDSDAVFIATGLQNARGIDIKGIQGKSEKAIELLNRFRKGEEIPVGKNIIIIGGGNVAFDIARTLSRLQRQKYGKVSMIITSLEKEEELPADLEELVESREEGLNLESDIAAKDPQQLVIDPFGNTVKLKAGEKLECITVINPENGKNAVMNICTVEQTKGVMLEPSRAPQEVIFDEKGNVRGLKTVKCLSVFDENKRFHPVFDLCEEKIFYGDMIVEAIGQSADYSYLGDFKDQLEFEQGRIKSDEKGRTSLDWFFIGGDILHGPDIIHGIADGHRSAQAIDEYLNQ
ncbi:MAG: hypothetical protein A2Y41_11890 [Spirochaetes bacterium GWB1_36_13]|nr:MAG: hypothetical protein A2Y41_11890 [Spirochaetes bacterium GWB1_36_13]